MPYDHETEVLTDTLTIHVIDDNEAHRESVSWFLRGQGHTVASYNNAPTFMQAFNPKALGIVILDIEMPGIDGMELLNVITYEECLMPIIMLSGHGNLQNGVEAMKQGAIEFLEKPFNTDKLLATVQTAVTIAHERIFEATCTETLDSMLSALTKREREVYDLMLFGKTNKMTALELDIGVRTVEHHRRNMLEKLGVTNLADLIALSQTSQ